MDHKERFYETVERNFTDRPASWLGLPDKKAYKGLFQYFGIKNMNQLRNIIDDDIYPVEMPYHSPTSNAIYTAFNFAGKDMLFDESKRTLTAPGFFEQYSNPSRIEDFDWPQPEKYIDLEECRNAVESAPQDRAVLGIIWSAHFQDACAAFGMETALVKMITEPEMFKVVIDKITDFYLRANYIFYEGTKGMLDAVLIGNDFGSQTGLMLSPDLLRKYVFSGTKKLIKQAHDYGLKVIHHSCGSIIEIIPDLIEMGADVIHPIQALAKDMEAEKLKHYFSDKISFCGGVDAQQLLVNGTPEQIKKRVYELKELFPTGLIISPSHEAILPDINPANIEALFEAVKE